MTRGHMYYIIGLLAPLRRDHASPRQFNTIAFYLVYLLP